MKTSHTILIVDDDPIIRESLDEILSYEGYKSVSAADGKEALEKLNADSIDLMLLDLRLPRIDGMTVLKKSIENHPNIPVVMISGQGTIQLAVEATKLGAYDFLEKPLEAERTLLTVRNALEKSQLKIQRDRLLAETREKYHMIGKDPKMQEIFTLIDRAANVDSKVIITGESGTGKEMVARAIHYNSLRNKEAFVPVNCSAIPENLIESELFGHKRGAFTGALADRDGKFYAAHKGTIFLDEIGDMSLMVQAKILRTIEDGKINPVGSKSAVQIDVRIISATHKDLQTEVENGNFRKDLFYRLHVIHIHLPPLRERKGDLKPLAEMFLQEICKTNGLPQKSIAQNAWPLLFDYNWPGNVRELRNIVERAAVITGDIIIDTQIISEALQHKSIYDNLTSEQTLRAARSRFEKEFILKTLTIHNNKIRETADALGIQRSHLWKKMKEYKIDKVEN